jgi:hypothetical protein
VDLQRLLFFGEPQTVKALNSPSLIYALARVPHFKNLKPSLSNVETCHKIEIEMLLRLIFAKKNMSIFICSNVFILSEKQKKVFC